ncbi:hypothetical protein DY000_02062969 [Brassica cretica]|uniref:Uncharacterized protein n=1 Tax=Brassica cretica TaxID=69181 RepID=A0ABQ7AQP5_BRACR|nr:hypothetical protein DY000_02062969 [Brassica cretica]
MDFPMVQSSEIPTKYSSEFSSENSEERVPRKIPRNGSLRIFRGTCPSVYSEERGPSVYSEEDVPRYIPRVQFLGIPPVEPPSGSPTKICDHPCPSTEPLKKMGQDYSYSQPSSSSDSLDITSLLEAEAQIYADETDSSNRNAMPVQYPRQPEADDGIPTTCYCGAQPVLGCSYTPIDPYRRYFTCDNADDGDCHV